MARQYYIWYDDIPLKSGGTSVKAFIQGYDRRNPKKILTKTRPTRELAEAWVAEQIHTLNEGTWQDPAKRRRPLRYYGNEWWRIKKAHLRPTTLRNYKRWLDKHVLVRFGDDPVGEITEFEIELFLADKRKDYSPKTINEILNVLDGVLEMARKDKAIPTNPAKEKRLPVDDFEGIRVTMDQIIDFIDCIAPRYRDLRPRYQAAVWVLIYTGLRSGEVWGLRICDINWATGDAKVIKTYGTTGGYDDEPYGHAEGPVKTKAGKREVHIPEFVLDQLQAEVEARGLTLDSEEPLFLNKDGEQVKRDTFQQRIIRPAAERAGLPKGFRAHDLRGSHISLLLELGANIKAITAEVGHTKGEVTLNKYARTLPGSQAKLTAMIEASRQAALEARRQTNIVALDPAKSRKKVESQRESPGQRGTESRKS